MDGLTLAQVLTVAGAVTSAALITGLVEVLKASIPVIGRRQWEQSLALLFSLVLVVLAFVDQAVYTLPAAFTAFVAWLAIAKLATGIHDEITQRPGALLGPSA